jgi:hypothetical protein
MSTIVLRSVKGSPLTNAEVDANFTNLNNDKTQLGGTYSSGTANGVLYLSASKVLTTGSALVFDGTTFATSAVGSFTGGVGIAGAGNPSSGSSVEITYGAASFAGVGRIMSFDRTASVRTPLAFDGSYQAWLISNSEKMRLTSTGLGIGTSSPANRLHVNSGTLNNVALFESTDATALSVYKDDTTTLDIGVGATADNLVFVNNTERMRIDSSGNLGIGTTSPTNRLSVTGNANITGNVTLGDASTDTVQVNGYMGVGGAANSTIAAYVQSTALTGSTQTGFYSSPTSTTAATSRTVGFSSQPKTADSAYTCADVIGFYAQTGTKGAASTVTNWYGIQIADQTQGTNNYGITSLVSSGTNKWNIYASGTAQNYFAGNVGIGTTSPVSVLDVAGTTPVLTIKDTQSKSWVTGDTVGDLDFYSADPSGSGPRTVARIRSFADNTATTVAGALSFWTSATDSAATEKVRITSAGNVGIGTTSPLGVLDVAGIEPTLNIRDTQSKVAWAAGETVGTLDFYSNDTSGVGAQAVSRIRSVADTASAATSGALAFWTAAAGAAATEKVRITSAGNLGLGTTSPSGASGTTIAINGGAGQARLALKNTSTGDASGDGLQIALDNTAGGIEMRENLPLYFTTNNTERMRLDAAGNLGVGSTAPSYKLDVVGDIQAQGRLLVTAAAPELLFTVPSGGLDSRIYNDGSGNLIFGNGTNSTTPTERMRIDASGNVQLLTGAIVVDAPAPASISTTATLTNANIQTQIINTTGTSYTVTMPLGTTMETLVPWATTDLGYDFTVINTASGTITMAVNTGVTSLGGLTIATGVSAGFRIRRTAANTFVLYRLR